MNQHAGHLVSAAYAGCRRELRQGLGSRERNWRSSRGSRGRAEVTERELRWGRGLRERAEVTEREHGVEGRESEQRSS
eukprot:941082-Rhodomonas_salina.1